MITFNTKKTIIVCITLSVLISFFAVGCTKEVEVVMPDGETQMVEIEKETTIINPFEYYDVVFAGYNGYGKASVEVNPGNTDRRYFYFDFDKSYNLANGDVVCVSVDTDGIYNDGTTIISPAYKEFKVQGLKELTEIDPFENLELQFDGISPYATVAYNTSACPDVISKNIVFYNDSQYLKNGETFEVKADLKWGEDSLGEEGYKISKMSREYTVEDVSYYIDNLDGVDLSELNQLMDDYVEAEANKVYNNYKIFGRDFIDEPWYNDTCGSWLHMPFIDKVETPIVEKGYFCSIKQPTTLDMDKVYNKYIRIYKVKYNAHCNDSYSTGTAIVAVFMENIVMSSDGKLKYNSTEDLNSQQLYYRAEDTVSILESSYIVAEKAKYNVSEVK